MWNRLSPIRVLSFSDSWIVVDTGVPASEYQFAFDHITQSGNRPVWVDVYEVNGKNYFNAIFRQYVAAVRNAQWFR